MKKGEKKRRSTKARNKIEKTRQAGDGEAHIEVDTNLINDINKDSNRGKKLSRRGKNRDGRNLSSLSCRRAGGTRFWRGWRGRKASSPSLFTSAASSGKGSRKNRPEQSEHPERVEVGTRRRTDRDCLP